MQYSINDSIFKQVVDQLDPKQFSMKRKSTCHALVFFLHTILTELDRGENYVRSFFADFSKGFAGCKENEFYSLPKVWQAVTNIY